MEKDIPLTVDFTLTNFFKWCLRFLLLELGSRSNSIYMFLRLWPVCPKIAEFKPVFKKFHLCDPEAGAK